MINFLKKLINVFKPKHVEDGDFDPWFANEEVPSGCREWLNQHYHFLITADNTEETDYRKPIKLKTPKSKSKLKVRPNLNRGHGPSGKISDRKM